MLPCELRYVLYFLLCVWSADNLYADGISRNLKLEPGHLKPFGFGRPSTRVDEFKKFPNPTYFFENYVKPLKPLVMRGAAKYSKAFFKWTDDYLLNLNEPDGHTIAVETVKKESRQQKMESISFLDFVKTYNMTQYYMVAAVPEFLRHEVMLPCPLQCREMVENHLVDNVMWFSSGGTKSVVHTDAVDNINCLYRGEKELYFIDPSVYGHKVDIDRPEGAYSAMDVDSVDFEKYPGLADIEYYHVNLSAGDCLYIPYKWIHQVRSYHSNIAVNVWWKHHLSEALNYDLCNDPCDPDLTLEEVNFAGFGEVMQDPNEIRDHFKGLLRNEKELPFRTLLTDIIGSDYRMLIQNAPTLLTNLNQMYTLLDHSKDGIITDEDIGNTSDKIFKEIAAILLSIEDSIETVYNDEAIDIDEPENGDVGDDSDETDDDNLIVKDEL